MAKMFQIPFTTQPADDWHPSPGSMSRYHGRDCDWLDNHVFEASMEVVGWHPTAASAQFVLKTDDGREFFMFMNDGMKIIPLLKKAKVSGEWTFRKQGSAIGLVYLGAK